MACLKTGPLRLCWRSSVQPVLSSLHALNRGNILQRRQLTLCIHFSCGLSTAKEIEVTRGFAETPSSVSSRKLHRQARSVQVCMVPSHMCNVAAAPCRSCVAQAQPNKKGPDKTVKVYCAKCQEQLYKYKKVSYMQSHTSARVLCARNLCAVVHA